MDTQIYTLHEKLRLMAAELPNQPAIQIKKDSQYIAYTYQEIYQQAQNIAAFLINSRIKPGDKIAIILENCPEWAFIYFGIVMAGATAVPIDIQSHEKDLHYFLEDSSCKIIFASINLLATLNTLANNLSELNKIIILGDHEIKTENNKIINFGEIQKNIDDTKIDNKIFPQVSPDNLASILYTSGTTGKPKGVMLSHHNFYSNFLSFTKTGFSFYHNNVLSILPLHHSFPFITFIIPLFSQCKITFVESLKSEDLLECMRESGVGIFVGVPQIFYLFHKKLESEIKKIPFLIRTPLLSLIEIFWWLRKLAGLNLNKILLAKIHKTFGKKLKYFVSGGAKLDSDTAKFFMKIGFTVIEGYGLSETAPIVTFNLDKLHKIDSVGKVIPDVSIKIIETGSEQIIDAPVGAQRAAPSIGEIVISGPNVMQGYYKHPEATAEAIKDGWFYSGDLGHLDNNGYLYITGRKKELIILSSGKNISAEEIELHFSSEKLIKEICVLAVGEKETERLMAVIVPDFEYAKKNGEVDIQGNIRWHIETLSKQLPPYKRIMGFIITKEALPRTRLGKLKRFAVKEKYLAELLGNKVAEPTEEIVLSDTDLKLLSSPTAQQIIAVLNEETNPVKPIQPDDHLEIDLGLESLGRIELIMLLERVFKLKIPNEVVTKVSNVRDLITEIQNLIHEQNHTAITSSTTTKPQSEESLWKDILQTELPKDLLKKISVNPTPFEIAFANFAKGTMFTVFKLFSFLKINGAENLPINENMILCSNHNSFLDGFVIEAALPTKILEHTFFLGLKTFFEAPVIKNFAKTMRFIPIDPGTQMIAAMQASAYVLRNKKAICIFPEGERSIDGKVKEFKKGVGILAKELNVRIVPIYIDGTFEAWPRGEKLPKPHRIIVTFGKPCELAELQAIGYKLNAKNAYEAIAKGIREKVIALQKSIF